ncbi:HAD family phosphatase [Catenulispora sp. NL8]|uniref:HAD family phosphatase n=1 Tax=Catenulispora pinistramenti TaxID=2705254 RepID=A0ABS5KHH2_9ACTN|nr:HAD family phosphatase [Catenulispora pinistramenti]MBS2545497.1 HAD family phosphatase [Catenulispora pinistramenti]
MSVRRFKGLIFDFFGVLTSNMVEVIECFEDREQIPRGTFLRAWADPRGKELFTRLELGEISQTDWNQGYATLMGVAPDGLMSRYLYDAFPAHETLKFARQARSAGYKTAVLSNSLGRTPYDPYAGFDLRGIFDEVVLSEDHGMRKPDPAVFHLLLDKLDVRAEECVFVDDSEENLQAAVELGMTIVYAADERKLASRLRTLLELPVL